MMKALGSSPRAPALFLCLLQTMALPLFRTNKSGRNSEFTKLREHRIRFRKYSSKSVYGYVHLRPLEEVFCSFSVTTLVEFVLYLRDIERTEKDGLTKPGNTTADGSRERSSPSCFWRQKELSQGGHMITYLWHTVLVHIATAVSIVHHYVTVWWFLWRWYAKQCVYE